MEWAQKFQEIARVGRVGEDPREDVGVGVVECGLYASVRAWSSMVRQCSSAGRSSRNEQILKELAMKTHS